MFLYIKTNILRGYGIFKNDFAHPREPANVATTPSYEKPNDCEKDIELFERLQDEFIFYKKNYQKYGDINLKHFYLDTRFMGKL